MVTNLPRNATMREVFDHFNNLYDLSKEDWTFPVRTCALLPHVLTYNLSPQCHFHWPL